MARPLSMIFAVAVATFGASAANAGTHWSVGINLPVQGVVVTNSGHYVSDSAPIYYAPAPVVRHAPVPIYNAPTLYAPPVAVYDDEPAVYEVPYRVETYGTWYDQHGSRWERRRQFEHARWERARHERDERQWDRDDHRNGARWHRH